MSGIMNYYKPEVSARIQKKAEDTLAAFQQVLETHARTGEWPTERNPVHGEVMRTVNAQLKRVRRDLNPSSNIHSGWSTELHQLVMRSGYKPPDQTEKGRAQGKNGVLGRVEAILAAGGMPDAKDIRELCERYRSCILSERSAERLRAHGLVIT